MNSTKRIPEYFIQNFVAKFSLENYTEASSDLNVRYPSTPILLSPNFLEAFKFLEKADKELDQSATQVFFLTKLSNLSRRSFRDFLKKSKKCKEVFLLPKITFDGFESPAPFPLILLHLTRENPPNENVILSVW